MFLHADVLIIGSGIAGLYAALNLAENLNVIVVTKNTLNDCNSYLAQGGISTARNEEDVEVFVKDTLKAGKFKNRVQSVEILARESMENINKLIGLGVNFDKKDGELHFTREGAHSVNRIVHCKDRTGEVVFKTLIKKVKERKNISIIEEASLVDVMQRDNICFGGIIVKDHKVINIYSKMMVLATGGIGGLFRNSTNFNSITGDGLAIAIRSGIEVDDLSYIQFHPTSLYEELKGRRFLISEAVRGEGAHLLNVNGKRFIDELLPRDVVAKAIIKEEQSTNSKFVYLDIRHKEREYIIDRFPSIYNTCRDKGIDITRDMIPVTPAQHYFMGGIKVDGYSRTSMKNMFACGEVSCTGVHGENRLASNSLLESLVFSKRAADIINKDIYNKDNLLNVDYKKISMNEAIKIIDKNKSILLREFMSRRGDLKNELVNY